MPDDLRWMGDPERGRGGTDDDGILGERRLRDHGRLGSRYRGDYGRQERGGYPPAEPIGREHWARDWSAGDREAAAAQGRYRGRGPRGYRRSDERIREDVNDRLTDDPWVDATDIEVGVAGGEVTLAGLVEDRATRRRAEDIAESVSGVTLVQNNLRMRPAEGAPAPAPEPKRTGRRKA